MRNIILGLLFPSALAQCINKGYIIDGDGNCVCGGDGYAEINGICEELEQCSNEFNPCNAATQICMASVKGPVCTCKSGFEMSSVDGVCVDIDECDLRLNPNPCPFDKPNCLNTPGSYSCQSKQCDNGTHLEYGVCMDIDECDQGSHYCSQGARCFNTEGQYNDDKGGSYECRCLTGYELDIDGLTCNDIDECATLRHDCRYASDFRGELPDYDPYKVENDIECVNTEGSYECVCPSSYELLGHECILTEVSDSYDSSSSEVATSTTMSTSDGETSNVTVQVASFFEENLVIIFAAGGTVFLLIAIAIIICCIKSRQRQRHQESYYTSATLQKLNPDNKADDYTTEDEQKSKYKETFARADSFDTLGSSNDDDSNADHSVPLSKFQQPTQSMKNQIQQDLPPPPDVLMNSPAIVRGGAHAQSVSNQNYTQINPQDYR